MKIENV